MTDWKALDIAAAAIERAKANSKQPRYERTDEGALAFWRDLTTWLRSDTPVPEYRADSRELDRYLSSLWKKEPHLKGVMYSATSIERGRGWELVGAKSQVKTFRNVLHRAEDGAGWRHYINQQALSFFSTNLGSLTELGTDGENGPVTELYHLDPTRCHLTGKRDEPLEYQPARGRVQRWKRGSFFRVCSLPSIEEIHAGLGLCAVYRCYEMAKLLMAIYEYDAEQLGARAPKGLLLLQNITPEMWEDAMAARDTKLDAEGWQRFGGVSVLASMGELPIDAKLVALSNLPTGLSDRKVLMDLVMYTYALCFGYDPVEFWPVNSGVLGRGVETQVQHQKATAKGGMDFALSYQEQLQEVLPDSLDFQFDQRDTNGEMQLANLANAWAGVAERLYKAGLEAGAPIITDDQARSLLVNANVIPQEWSKIEEDERKKDVSRTTDRAYLEQVSARYKVRAAAAEFEREPIVRYHWPLRTEVTLFESGAALLAPHLWAVERELSAPVEVNWGNITDGVIEVLLAGGALGFDESGQRLGGAEAVTNADLALLVSRRDSGLSLVTAQDFALLAYPSWRHPLLCAILTVARNGTMALLRRRADVDYEQLPLVRQYVAGHEANPVKAVWGVVWARHKATNPQAAAGEVCHAVARELAEMLHMDYERVAADWGMTNERGG